MIFKFEQKFLGIPNAVNSEFKTIIYRNLSQFFFNSNNLVVDISQKYFIYVTI